MQFNTRFYFSHLFISAIVLMCLFPLKIYANDISNMAATISQNSIAEEISPVTEANAIQVTTLAADNKELVPAVTADNTELAISLTAPETALINVAFPVSIETSNCSHIEWYINGEYVSKLTSQINPEGTLLFSDAGTYKITVIGYNRDWSKHVKDSKKITVTDESYFPHPFFQ